MCTTLLIKPVKVKMAWYYSIASSWFSVLGEGVTSANFQEVGNLHVSMEVLITDVPFSSLYW